MDEYVFFTIMTMKPYLGYIKWSFGGFFGMFYLHFQAWGSQTIMTGQPTNSYITYRTPPRNKAGYDQGLLSKLASLSKAGYQTLISEGSTLGGGWLIGDKTKGVFQVPGHRSFNEA